jgi:Na+-transporting methylmalonyl-CoA/oxaloacetate decarboxylase gamma subunit
MSIILRKYLKNNLFLSILILTLLISLKYHSNSFSSEIKPELQKKLTKKMDELKELAMNPVIVAAVESENKNPSYPDMNQIKWESLDKTAPIIWALSHNKAASQLLVYKNNHDDVSEAFINNFYGTKVALLAKTTRWEHSGQDKHKLPMQDKVWQGPLEFDQSEDIRQIQLSVPIKDEKKLPIGSLVVGFNVLVAR